MRRAIPRNCQIEKVFSDGVSGHASGGREESRPPDEVLNIQLRCSNFLLLDGDRSGLQHSVGNSATQAETEDLADIGGVGGVGNIFRAEVGRRSAAEARRAVRQQDDIFVVT